MTDHQESLIRYLRAISVVQAQCVDPGPPEWQYRTIEEFGLEHGQFFPHAPRPKGLRLARPKECFRNAMRLAGNSSGLTYVEGWAMRPELGLPIHHAWCVTTEGNVVDVTWRERKGDGPAVYFGVPFTSTQILTSQVETQKYGMFYTGGAMAYMTWPRKKENPYRVDPAWAQRMTTWITAAPDQK